MTFLNYSFAKTLYSTHISASFLFFLQDLRKELIKLAEFLEVDLPEEHIPILEDHLSFQNFRNNSSVNMEFLIPDKSFIRKGNDIQYTRKALSRDSR